MALLACSSTQRITQVGDKRYRIECETSLAQCLGQLDRVCPEGFHVDEADDERRTYGITVGSAQTEVRSSKALATCHSDPIFGGKEDSSPKLTREPEAVEPAPARVCTPGATQTCIGGGGCSGGQACLADGSGFSACDCSPPASPVPAPLPLTTTPASPTDPEGSSAPLPAGTAQSEPRTPTATPSAAPPVAP